LHIFPITSFAGRAVKSDKGFAFVETIVALALLGIIAAVLLSSVGTATKATMVADEQVTAESLARSEIEYIKNCAYQYQVTEYPIDSTLDIPSGWSVNTAVEAISDRGSDIQKVTITVQRGGENELSVITYKVDR
jgi:prepilin-type N-terminal cleavage/methylation domain-containing protein